jgi:3-phosphoshikimate 1-carboxyvinyltransferase
VAAAGPAGSCLSGLEHLQHKESDRLAVMVGNLGRLGAAIETAGPSITIRAPMKRGGAVGTPVTAAADHRVAMAMAVAALAAGTLELDDDECVVKSFPGFWNMWRQLTASDPGQP